MDDTKKRGIHIGATVLISMFVVWMLFRETPVSVETAISKRSRMTVTVNGEGKTRVRDKFTVTAPISGLMTRIKLTEGNNIPRDYPIAEIDPNAPIQRAPVAPRDTPNPYAAKVFAPVNGKILRVFDKSERYVSAGTPILELGNPENIEIVVDILSTEAVLVRPGAPMLIETAKEAEFLKARVRLVEPQAITKISALGVEEQRVNVIGEFLSKDLRFGDNFRVDVRIVVWEKDGVLVIPSSSLFRSDEEWTVFVVDDGNAQRKAITIGHQNTEVTEVLGGLEEGETVIVHPPNQLVDGTKVNVR